MGLYGKAALDILGALINRDNPSLKTQLNSSNIVLLGGPYTTGLGTSGRNTRVVINGKTGAGVTGKKEFFYDRLNLGDLFKNLTVVFQADNKVVTVGDLLPALNEQYGIYLTADDVTNAGTNLGFGYTPTAVTFNIATTSLVYRGTLSATWTRKAAGVYPDSGPGSKTMLIGDMSAGYFGTVSQDEMFNSSEVMQEMFAGSLPAGVSIVVDPAMLWIKFAIDNEFVFFPTKNIASNISWNTLDAAGAVIGNRNVPLLLEKNGMQLFLPRLPKMGDADPIEPVRGDPTSDAARLFNKVHNSSYGTAVWDIISTLDQSAFWWKNSRVGFETSAFVAGANQAGINSTAKTGNSSWRPLLKLVDGKDYVLPMRSVQGVAVMPLQRIDFFIDSARDPNMLLPMENVEGNLYLKFPAPVSYAPVYDTIAAVPNLSGTKPIQSIVASFTATYDTRFNLSTANAELDGF